MKRSLMFSSKSCQGLGLRSVELALGLGFYTSWRGLPQRIENPTSSIILNRTGMLKNAGTYCDNLSSAGNSDVPKKISRCQLP